jgi:hypothetical protein
LSNDVRSKRKAHLCELYSTDGLFLKPKDLSNGKGDIFMEDRILPNQQENRPSPGSTLETVENGHNLVGMVFGDLTVLERNQQKHDYGGIWWRTKCNCGAEYDVPGTLLVKGRRTHCGCKSASKGKQKDITGQKFGRLTPLSLTNERDKKGYAIWLCRCDCGNEIKVSYNRLCYSLQKSCGCQKVEHNQQLKDHLNRVDGTCVDRLCSKKVPVNNTTGYPGVYYTRGKYIAKIVIQKKQYLLGTYKYVEDAAAVRRIAEKHIQSTIIPNYEKWKKRSLEDEEWGKKNPFKICVERDAMNMIKITCLPELNAFDVSEKNVDQNALRRKMKTEQYQTTSSW